LLLDRWSRSVVLKEVFALYEAFRKGRRRGLPPLRPYGEYIAWLESAGQAAAERYWRTSLKDFVAPTALAIDRKSLARAATHTDYGAERMQLSEASTERLREFARAHQADVEHSGAGFWALLLSHYSGEDDVTFGVTVAGRPATLPGVESMVPFY